MHLRVERIHPQPLFAHFNHLFVLTHLRQTNRKLLVGCGVVGCFGNGLQQVLDGLGIVVIKSLA